MNKQMEKIAIVKIKIKSNQIPVKLLRKWADEAREQIFQKAVKREKDIEIENSEG